MESDSFIIPFQSQQPQPVEAITFMDSDLFKAAEVGDMEPFNKYQDSLHCLLDGRLNTALHIHLRVVGIAEKDFSRNFVEQLVDKYPPLLLQPNDRGEIPLHIAVQYGHREIVDFLIERAKVAPPLPHDDLEKGTLSDATGSWLRRMLRVKDKGGDTAFHKAARSFDVELVRLVLKELDPEFSMCANKMGETPLYIAAGRSFDGDVVAEILDHCKSIDYGGPHGTTALHAAVIAGGDQIRTIKRLLKAKKELAMETDDNGRTPLHYAAHLGPDSTAKLLFKMNPSAAYVRDKDRGMTALHMAAWVGRADIMQYIISNCPGCCEIVDEKGWNFLHYAAVVLQPREFQRVLSGDDKRSMIKDLPIWRVLFEKDVNGNTPVDVFYLFSHSRRSGFSTVFSFLKIQGFDKFMSDWDANYAKKKKRIREIVNEIGSNGGVAGILPHKHFREDMDEGDHPSTLKEIVNNLRETHLLVAALVATVTFAAAIAVPGGYKSDKGNDEGTATLSRNSAFKAFIITDALAFVSSLLAIFLHFLCVFIDLKVAKSAVLNWILMADGLTVFAMAAMVVSFSAGTYAVLESSMGIAIATSSIGLTFFPFSIIVPFFIYYFFKPDH